MKPKLRLPLYVFAFVALTATGRTQAPEPTTNGDGALAAMAALPAQYKDGIMKISADAGAPEPSEWYILANQSGKDGELKSITIAGGKIMEEKTSLDLRTIFGESSAISLEKVKVDSSTAWAVTAKYLKSRRKIMQTASYVLEQKGKDSTPVWSVGGYNEAGDYLGRVTLLATTGEIVTVE